MFVAQSLDSAAYSVDVGTGVATRIGGSPVGVGDNIAALPDGRVLFSAFAGGRIGVFTPAGSVYTASTRTIGS